MQGIYTLVAADGARTIRSVNLADLATSDLEDVSPLKVEAGSDAMSEQAVIRTSLTPYLLAAAMSLLVLESLLVYSQRRSALPMASR
jgi:hypothetical protein